MLQSKGEDRIWAKQNRLLAFDSTSDEKRGEETEQEDEKFSMMEFAFRYFRQEYVPYLVHFCCKH